MRRRDAASRPQDLPSEHSLPSLPATCFVCLRLGPPAAAHRVILQLRLASLGLWNVEFDVFALRHGIPRLHRQPPSFICCHGPAMLLGEYDAPARRTNTVRLPRSRGSKPMSQTIQRLSRDEALEYLVSRIDYERSLTIPYGQRTFKLDRMRNLLERLGCPQLAYPVVHVAGTKGKGSTSAMIASMLTAAGYRTGLYSSPHLHRLEERLAVDGAACTGEELAELVSELRPIVAELDAQAAACQPPEPGPTYFDLTTALAMLHFARRGVDAAVLEVGVGGRLDSTNVCQPSVCVITNISFDHMNLLGNTLAEIAREKAGIIKPGVPVVSGVVDAEPQQVIRSAAAAAGCRLDELGREFGFVYHPPQQPPDGACWGKVDLWYHGAQRRHAWSAVELSLPGRHQAANAALAVATAVELSAQGFRIDEAAMRESLRRLRWPGRIELVRRRPPIVIDVAHNVASIAALVETLAELYPGQPRALVFATTVDKQVREMLALLRPHFEHVILTRYLNNPRGVPVEVLARLAREVGMVGIQPAENARAAWELAQPHLAAGRLLCVCGSFFIAAEMRAIVAGGP